MRTHLDSQGCRASYRTCYNTSGACRSLPVTQRQRSCNGDQLSWLSRLSEVLRLLGTHCRVLEHSRKQICAGDREYPSNATYSFVEMRKPWHTFKMRQTSSTRAKSLSERRKVDHGIFLMTFPFVWVIVIGPKSSSAAEINRLMGCKLSFCCSVIGWWNSHLTKLEGMVHHVISRTPSCIAVNLKF